MGRQQITVDSDEPIVNDRRHSTVPGGNAGLINNGRLPLPQAGWQPYAPVETPGINPNLPKVPTPIRQSHTAPRTGSKGHAGALRSGAHGQAQPNSGVKSYSPYAKYPESPANTQAAQDLEASTRVKGSLLHWARHKPGQ